MPIPVPVEYWPHIAAILVFLCVMLIWTLFTRSRDQRKILIHKIQHSGLMTQDGLVGSVNMGSEESGKIASFLDQIGKRVMPNKIIEGTRIRFLKVGIRGEIIPAVFWGVKLILAVLAPITFLLVKAILPLLVLSPAKIVLALGLSALAGFYLPDMWLYNRRVRRKKALLEGFPNALDLLVVCVEAGMGLDAAVNRVAREIQLDNPTLSDELNLFNLEMRAGMQRRDALKNLSLRTDLAEINRLSTLLIQTDRFGTSVGTALKVFSDTMRSQRYQRAEELAGALPVKLLFPMILFIFPSLFVVIIGPAAIRIYHAFLSK
jgi:tight adherence protein C